MKLESYTANLFVDYCARQGISNASWAYLSNKRKLVWLKEASFLLKSSIKEIKKQIKPLGKTGGQASYEIGYNQGMYAERLSMISLLEYLESDIQDQFETLQQHYNSKED